MNRYVGIVVILQLMGDGSWYQKCFFFFYLICNLLFLRYNHGAPVARATVILRYGYISGKNPPTIIPSSLTLDGVRHQILFGAIGNQAREKRWCYEECFGFDQ